MLPVRDSAGGSVEGICPLLLTAAVAFFLPPAFAGLFVGSRSILCNKIKLSFISYLTRFPLVSCIMAIPTHRKYKR